MLECSKVLTESVACRESIERSFANIKHRIRFVPITKLGPNFE